MSNFPCKTKGQDARMSVSFFFSFFLKTGTVLSVDMGRNKTINNKQYVGDTSV